MRKTESFYFHTIPPNVCFKRSASGIYRLLACWITARQTFQGTSESSKGNVRGRDHTPYKRYRTCLADAGWDWGCHATGVGTYGKSQETQRRMYNQGSKICTFNSGDKVLVLVPKVQSKFLAKSPYEIKERVGEVHYKVYQATGKFRTYFMGIY